MRGQLLAAEEEVRPRRAGTAAAGAAARVGALLLLLLRGSLLRILGRQLKGPLQHDWSSTISKGLSMCSGASGCMTTMHAQTEMAVLNPDIFAAPKCIAQWQTEPGRDLQERVSEEQVQAPAALP